MNRRSLLGGLLAALSPGRLPRARPVAVSHFYPAAVVDWSGAEVGEWTQVPSQIEAEIDRIIGSAVHGELTGLAAERALLS